jgi:hypothetical protein
MSFQTELADLFRRDLTRLTQELELFPGDAYAWKTLPGVKNSAGNLTLHLEGNLRHYIGNHLAGIAYQRDREWEFSTHGMPVSGLIARVEPLKTLIPGILAGLPDAKLEELFPEPTWGERRITRLFLIHLYGHLNLHLGQISYLRRILTEGPAAKHVQL